MNSEASTLPGPYSLGPEEGDAIWFLATRMTIKASAETTGGMFGLIDNRSAAGFSPPLHVHQREDEAAWILEGEVRFVCGDNAYETGPGSFIFLPRGIPHTFRVEGTADARILFLMLPGGFEQFHVEGGRPATDASIPVPTPDDIAKVHALASKYGNELVGPPLGPRVR